MSRVLAGALLALALAGGFARADEKDTKKGGPKENEVMALFHDGTRVRTVILQGNLEVTTKYGKLTVPTKDVRRIEFGFRLTDEQAKKVESAVKDLGSTSFPARDAATKELIALGRLAYPAVLKAAKGADPETVKRSEDVLKAIRDKVPAEQLRARLDDLVHTTDFTISGRVDTATLRAQSDHFGEVQLKVADLRALESTSGTGEAKLTIDAAVYGSAQNTWMDTKYMVNADVKLVVTAAGDVDLYGVQQPGQYISGPDGNRSVGGARGTHIPGMLLGRIGEDGPTFVVGKRYEVVPTQEGKLYLRIVPLQGSGGSTGNYEVKVVSGNN